MSHTASVECQAVLEGKISHLLASQDMPDGTLVHKLYTQDLVLALFSQRILQNILHTYQGEVSQYQE